MKKFMEVDKNKKAVQGRCEQLEETLKQTESKIKELTEVREVSKLVENRFKQLETTLKQTNVRMEELEEVNEFNKAVHERCEQLEASVRQTEVKIKELLGIKKDLEEKSQRLHDSLKQNDAQMCEQEETILKLRFDVERKDASIASRDDNLATAETLLKELNESKNETKKQLS